MSLESAAKAVRALLRVIEVAQDMRTALATGIVLDEVLREAEALLVLGQNELAGLDRTRHANLLAAAPLLRRKLERLSEELCGRSVS